jgi:peptide/nickel transport system permease protein
VPLALLILRRLALGVLTLWLVSLVVFFATQALPGDAARAMLGTQATPENLKTLRQQLGLDRPLVTQYGSWLGNTVRGSLGHSFAGTHEAVTTIIGKRVVNSAVLVAVAALVSVPISIGLGAYTALRRDTHLDLGVTVGTLTLASLPEFVIGIAVILLFATQVFKILPPVSALDPTESIWSQADLLVLPVLALTLAVMPYITRMMRASTIEVLESDYVSMARLKGGPETAVMWRHVFPNALVPAIQGTAIQLAWLAGGIVVIEYLFAYPGIGSTLVSAVANRDLPLIQALILLIASVYVLANLAADILTILLSPRLRTGLR